MAKILERAGNWKGVVPYSLLPTPYSLPEQHLHFLIARLVKFAVIETDRIEHIRHHRADKAVRLPRKFFARAPGPYRNRDDHGTGTRLYCSNCCPHACAGSQPVVRQDHSTSRDLRWRAAFAIEMLKSCDGFLLVLNHHLKNLRGDVKRSHDILVVRDLSTTRDRAHCEFFLPRRPQLPHDQDVQWQIARFRDFISYRHPASHQSKNDAILQPGQLEHRLCQNPPSVSP